MCERFETEVDVSVTLSARGLVPEDEIALALNGAEVHNFQRTFHRDGRLERFGRPLPPFSSVWFTPEPGRLKGWDNHLDVQLTSSALGATGDIVIDEVEVVVMPLQL